MPRSVVVVSAALAVSLGAIAGVARAEPLVKEECDKLQAEQTALAQAGVREQVGRGAEWGKANLSPPQLKSIERFIQLEEQLSFRCGLAKLRASLPLAEEGGEQEVDEKGDPIPAKAKPAEGQGTVKGTPVPPAASAKDKAAIPPLRTKSKAEAKSAPAKNESQPSAAKAAAKPKVKVDDAYRPPAKDPNADPFAGSAAPAQKKQ